MSYIKMQLIFNTVISKMINLIITFKKLIQFFNEYFIDLMIGSAIETLHK